jgi:ergothioneine biosynthesis protein EgtB
MADASPTKWHRAHTTWFFEQFLLLPHLTGYRVFDRQFAYLFNSYYVAAGPRHARPQRGLVTRPANSEVAAYRAHVDDAVVRLLGEASGSQLVDVMRILEIGLNHEQQHQELLLTDILHAFSLNPTAPAYDDRRTVPLRKKTATGFVAIPEGLHAIGFSDDGYCFDNEGPSHQMYLRPVRIAHALVTNGQWLDFIADGGYATPSLWLSDGWAAVQEEGWEAPGYWRKIGGESHGFTLAGLKPIDPAAPVCHVSYYEADAFARWAGARLPTEFEWESAASGREVAGNLLDSNYWQPMAADDAQYFGDVWEWTASAYLPYPGFTPLAGSLGEYNGKFMCNQLSVRGGSCVSSVDHLRASYRSFFYPDARWQFLGIRLARDLKV